MKKVLILVFESRKKGTRILVQLSDLQLKHSTQDCFVGGGRDMQKNKHFNSIIEIITENFFHVRGGG